MNYSRITHETLCLKLKNLRIGLFILATGLTCKNTQKTCFSQKINLKNFEKYGWYKSLPKTNKINKNLFDLIMISLSTHTSHLKMYNHINEIGIHWILDLCVVCVNQVWTSLLGSKDLGFYVFRTLICIVGKPWSKQCV